MVESHIDANDVCSYITWGVFYLGGWSVVFYDATLVNQII